MKPAAKRKPAANRTKGWLVAVVAQALIAMPSAASSRPPQASPSVGMEHSLEVELPLEDCRALPVDDRSPSMLRITGVRPSPNGGFLYDLRFTGFEPGTYDVLDHLVAADGTKVRDALAATSLPDQQARPITVEVVSVLPAEHQGGLYEHKATGLPFVGGYRLAIGLLSALWLGGTVYAWQRWRARRPRPAPTVEPDEPTWEERIRPLVEAAAAGTLDHAGKARLERMLVGFWREKLGTKPMKIKEELARLRAHPEAGKLLEALESWLHRRGGAPQHDVERLLAPYQHPPVSGTKGTP